MSDVVLAHRGVGTGVSGGLDGAQGRWVCLQRLAVAGFRHHQATRLWQALRKGQRLSLCRECDNPHDDQAVAVYLAGFRLGYLPRNANLMAATLLDRGRVLQARLLSKCEKAQRNERLHIELSLWV